MLLPVARLALFAALSRKRGVPRQPGLYIEQITPVALMPRQVCQGHYDGSVRVAIGSWLSAPAYALHLRKLTLRRIVPSNFHNAEIPINSVTFLSGS